MQASCRLRTRTSYYINSMVVHTNTNPNEPNHRSSKPKCSLPARPAPSLARSLATILSPSAPSSSVDLYHSGARRPIPASVSLSLSLFVSRLAPLSYPDRSRQRPRHPLPSTTVSTSPPTDTPLPLLRFSWIHLRSMPPLPFNATLVVHLTHFYDTR